MDEDIIVKPDEWLDEALSEELISDFEAYATNVWAQYETVNMLLK